ncbi:MULTISPECIES: fumarate reductase subunit FrdD [unclassified Endozoicomonas]|uniref:fumarate reductase subunit FrdD n=1 Tax=unclassified Endozoicomonas TaxID=2644528 RepID=UPI00207536F8|nr:MULTISPECIES: fumarate reductase subunit FrdD [unclassified Endozoicomonas]USE35262.1 fumarate reductase subunit D [Endozoicomonas sp. SCSIO W0465]
MSNKRHIEPLLWSLFGAGGTTIAFFFPAIIFVVGLGVPLEIIPAEALSYERMSAFFLESWIGKLALMVALVPSYWACIHRIYHGAHDLGFHPGVGVKVACYGGTLILSLATIALLLV